MKTERSDKEIEDMQRLDKQQRIIGFASSLMSQSNDMSNDEFSSLMASAADIIEALAAPPSEAMYNAYNQVLLDMEDDDEDYDDTADLVRIAIDAAYDVRLRSIEL